MHEMSIVEALIEQVRQETQAYPTARVSNIHLRIGALRLVVPETLRFCFKAAVCGTQLDGCVVEIEQLQATANCRKCRQTLTVEDNWFQCPHCGEFGSDLLTGNELELSSIDLE